jgi:hypothetical protein
MSDKGASYSEYCYLDELPTKLQENLVEIETSSDLRMILYEVKGTEAYWAIDEWDKYGFQIAVRINAKEAWKRINYQFIRERLLEKSRGGIEDTKCIWAGCSNNRVKGVAFCAAHMLQMGATR